MRGLAQERKNFAHHAASADQETLGDAVASATSDVEAANGSMIQTYGKWRAVLCFHGRQFTWDFVVAKPLLGADFLCPNSLLVDVKNRRPVKAEDFGSFPCMLSDLPTTTLSCALTASNEFSRLLCKFPDLTKPTFSTADTKHGVEHHIPTTGPPVHASKAHHCESLIRNSPTWNALA
ncbi:hypothetical protein AAFF_G00343080 [Aldrovandia affinis]|uniref:Uncharacterized protein n=1 Tax=Aldrovandia affinis TaxID=143900 RepID=A0AAD7SK18_9TELE|nr:hypothetical protein AAFF_G00343080 [Aldrovandia affinis]